MNVIALFLCVTAASIVWGLIRIGIRIGASKASQYIAEGFINNLDLKPNSEAGEEIKRRLKDHRPWYPIFRNADQASCEIRSLAIGQVLATAGFSQGMECQRVWEAPKREEATVSMKRHELFDVAWLADYGLRVWTMFSDNQIRCGDRLPRDKAENLSALLDTFERKIVDLHSETESEREMRFNSYENRMKRLWENYP